MEKKENLHYDLKHAFLDMGKIQDASFCLGFSSLEWP